MKTQRGVHSISSKAATIPELVTIILEYAWDQDPRNKFFRNYSLVCSNWRHIAQHILFTNIVLNNYGEASRFLRLVQANPALTRSTKSLDISRDVLRNSSTLLTSRKISHDVLCHTVRTITSACPQLYQLHISIWTDMLDQSLIKLIDENTYATLQALSLTIHPSSWQDDDKPTLYGIFSFICTFSSLSHLTLVLSEIDPPELSELSDLLHLKPSFKVYELNLQKSSDQLDAELFCLTMQWLLGAMDLEQLRILDLGSFRTFCEDQLSIQGPPPPHICLNFLERRGSGLHSLRLSMEAEDILEATRPLYVTCPQLRELILLNCSLPEAIREVIPVTYLEHLEFRVNHMEWDEEAPSKKVDWIISLPRIQHVTLRSHFQCKVKQPLQEGCIQGGIQFHFLEGLKVEGLLSPEDPIKVSHFPRMQTITNRGHMMIPSS